MPDIALPDGVRVHPSLHLLSWRPAGLLDAALGNEILNFIEREELRAGEPFNRFANMSDIVAVRLSFAEVEEIAERRVGHYHGAPVKSAILALNPLAFGMARMYQQLMRRSPIEVRVFCGIVSTAKWLDIPVEVLASL